MRFQVTLLKLCVVRAAVENVIDSFGNKEFKTHVANEITTETG